MRFGFVVAVAAAGVAVAVSGCSTVASIYNSQPTQSDYPHWTESASTGRPTPPAFVPHDATDMFVRALPTGASILTFTSATTLDPARCRAGTLTGKPALDANWWPIAKPPAEGMLCSGGWRLFTRNGVTFGWRP